MERKSHKNIFLRFAETWRLGLRSPLGRRFVAAIILCSSALAVVMTVIQLTVAYLDDRTQLHESIVKVEKSILPSLSESLWALDAPVIRSQLEGIAQLDGVTYVRLSYDGQELGVGDAALGSSEEYTYPVVWGVGDAASTLGQLSIGVSFEQIQSRTLRRAAVLLATNLLKTLLAAVLFLYFHQVLVGRHLMKLAAGASAFDPQRNTEPVTLDRQETRKGPDELDTLVQAMNDQSKVIATYVQRLQDANQEQSEFTYAISHDLKSPTNTMRMLLQELELTIGPERNEHRDEVLEDLSVTVDRMGKLIDGVLAYASAVGEDMQTQSVDLETEIRAIVRDLSDDIACANAEVIIEKLPYVEGSPVQLRLLFQNMISNAIKFRDANRRPVVLIKSVPDAADGWVKISIGDNGIGIDETHQGKIFDLFKRLHSKGAYEGSGIGLAVCKRIVSNHGGKIELSSTKGEGSTFTILLPGKRNDP